MFPDSSPSAPRTYVIAEAGVNHNGSPELAKELVRAAAATGADAVKFQTFRSESVVSFGAPKAEYQKNTTGSEESQLDMIRKLELSQKTHWELLALSRELGIEFLSTPFDTESAAFLVNEIGVPVVKVPSGEITNLPFLLYIASLQRPVIVSTGMSTLGEVETALGTLAYGYQNAGTSSDTHLDPDAFANAFTEKAGRRILHEKVRLLHCTTEYPCPFDSVNLRAMDVLGAAFGLPFGLSDHTSGYAVSVAAVARGATIIEKHFTLDQSLPGPDHRASLEPSEFTEMIHAIRAVESALGDGIKCPANAERGNRAIARRSLVTSRAVAAGETWTTDNLTCKRPGTGISPARFWAFLGQRASKSYLANSLVDEEHF